MKELTPSEKRKIEKLTFQIEWIKEGFDVQVQDCERWVDVAIPSWDNLLNYRRKPQLIEVPLEFDDIDLHRDLFKPKNSEIAYSETAASKSPTCLCVYFRGSVSYETLMKDFMRSIDGGKTWQPCSKMK